MESMNIHWALYTNGCKPICAQTVPKTFSEINASSLLAEQVNNRSSAQSKKAISIICSKSRSISVDDCLYGWCLLAVKERNQVLFLQGDNGIYCAYNWSGREIQGNVQDIVSNYNIMK